MTTPTDVAPRLVVGISSAEQSRYAIFYESLIGVRFPRNTRIIQARGANIAVNRNNITRAALDADATHILYVDDDQIFPPDTVDKLFAANKEVVSGLYLQRTAPFVPVMYDMEDERGWVGPQVLTPATTGLQRVLATGAGCLLVRTSLFARMKDPWWRLGELEDGQEAWSDDIGFCRRARYEAGAEIWCQTDAIVGHLTSAVVWPQRVEDGWRTVMLQGEKEIAQWAAVDAAPVLE